MKPGLVTKRISAFPERGDWKHTFHRGDVFKILVIGSNEEYAKSTTKWLSGTEVEFRGVYWTQYDNVKVALYYTWPNDELDLHQNTIGIDAVCVALENESQWDDLKKEVFNFPAVTVRLLISESENGKNQAKQIKGEFLQRTDNNAIDIIGQLSSMDISEFERLYGLFNKYDFDQSGTVDIKEMKSMASELNIEQNKAFEDSIKALDVNHDEQLNIEEFLHWYKIGRVHSLPISKIYELQSYVNSLVSNTINFNEFAKDVVNEELASKKNLNSIKIFLDSDKLEDIVTRIQGRICLGGPTRLDAAKNFLSKYTSVHTYSESSWLNIAVFTKPLSISGQELLSHMNDFRERIINWADSQHISGLSQFISQFVEYRSYANDSAANIYLKLKLDIESLMISALEQILIIRDWLSDEKNSFDASFRMYSSACLGQLIKEGKSVADILNEGELEINATMLKNRMRSLLSNLKPEFSAILGMFQFFFMSSNLDLKFKGPFDQFSKNGSFKFFNKPLDFFVPFLNFIRENFKQEIIETFSRMEITFNLFEMFGNFQVFSDTLWA